MTLLSMRKALLKQVELLLILATYVLADVAGSLLELISWVSAHHHGWTHRCDAH